MRFVPPFVSFKSLRDSFLSLRPIQAALAAAARMDEDVSHELFTSSTAHHIKKSMGGFLCQIVAGVSDKSHGLKVINVTTGCDKQWRITNQTAGNRWKPLQFDGKLHRKDAAFSDVETIGYETNWRKRVRVERTGDRIPAARRF